MARDEDDRKALGLRLKAARRTAGLTLQEVAEQLTELGYKISKAGVGHWETGVNVPDSLMLRRLAKLYESTADALLWDDTVSMDGIHFALQYDSLNDADQRKLKAMWLAYFQQAKTDEEVEQAVKAKSGLDLKADVETRRGARTIDDKAAGATARKHPATGRKAKS